MQPDREMNERLAMNEKVLEEQRETCRRLEGELKARRLQAVPETVLQSLNNHEYEQLLSVLLGLRDDQFMLSLTYIAFDLRAQEYRSLFEYLLTNKSFEVSVRASAACCMGGLFQETSNLDICTLLRKFLLDESEPDAIRERCYFALLQVKDLPPFPPDLVGSWNRLFDTFKFPEDVNWSLVFAGA